jgi:hypothetical protein
MQEREYLGSLLMASPEQAPAEKWFEDYQRDPKRFRSAHMRWRATTR